MSRFVLGNNDLVDPLSETPIVDGIPGPAGIHAGGDVEFGPDGNLFIATGDGGCDFRGDSGCYPFNDAAQDLGVLSGKVLRVTRTGGDPAGQPLHRPGHDAVQPDRLHEHRHHLPGDLLLRARNPFRIAVDPNSGTPSVRANDVGLNTWEEVNQLSPGGNFGWNVREGNCVRDSSDRLRPSTARHDEPDPLLQPQHRLRVHHGRATSCPTGSGRTEYDGDYLFGDLVCEKLWRLEPDGSGGHTATEFATEIPWLIDGKFAPDGASQSFYYISWVGFPDDVIRKIKYTGSPNRTPDADITADPTSGDHAADRQLRRHRVRRPQPRGRADLRLGLRRRLAARHLRHAERTPTRLPERSPPS